MNKEQRAALRAIAAVTKARKATMALYEAQKQFDAAMALLKASNVTSIVLDGEVRDVADLDSVRELCC